MTRSWESKAIALGVTNPLNAPEMSAADESRWQVFADELSGHAYNEVFQTWVDPLVTEPGIRSRLVASLTAPMGTPYPNVTSGGNLKYCFIHEALGKGNTPDDLRALVSVRPELAMELAQAILAWRETTVVYNDYDREEENWTIEQIRESVEQIDPELAGRLTVRSLVGDTMTYEELFGRNRKTYVGRMSERTPKVRVDDWHPERYDDYYDLALALQNPDISPEAAATLTKQWIDRVDKDEEYYPGKDTVRLREHIKTLANDDSSDAGVLTAIVRVMHDNNEPGDSSNKCFGTDVAFRVVDEDLKASLITEIVMQRNRTSLSGKDEQSVPRPLGDIDERRAAGWLHERLLANSTRTADQDLVLETCDHLIRRYNEEARQDARRENAYRACQAAVRHSLRGEANVFDFSI